MRFGSAARSLKRTDNLNARSEVKPATSSYSRDTLVAIHVAATSEIVANKTPKSAGEKESENT
jgi:hypothetical protein